jgi:hypothetical protein
MAVIMKRAGALGVRSCDLVDRSQRSAGRNTASICKVEE